MLSIKDKTIQLAQTAVHYLECGDPAWPTVVMLHGMKFQAQTWRELGTIDFLAALKQHVLAIDMPGFGKSPTCSCQPTDVLAQFLQKHHISQAALIGPSMGGRIAMEFAIQFPQYVSALVLLGAVGVKENQHQLSAITMPTLIIWGGEDQVSPLANSEILLSSLPKAKREIYETAPHPCYLDQPERWHADLSRFFTNLNQ